jgi:hypothetical protein
MNLVISLNPIYSLENHDNIYDGNYEKKYATNWKVTGSNPDEVTDFSIVLILPATLWPCV